MTRFLILFNSTESAKDQMASSSAEQVKTSMQEWIAWKEDAEAKKTIKFEWGMPLQMVSNINHLGEESSTGNEVGGYAIIEGNLDEVLGNLKNHPHLKRPGATISVLEMLPMTGMNDS